MVLLPAQLSARLPKLEFLGQYREAGLLLGAGLLAGILLFLVWLALLPGTDKALIGAQSSAAVAALQKPLGSAEGVLGDITGGPGLGQRARPVRPARDDAALSPPAVDGAATEQAGADAGLSAQDTGGDGQDLAGSLLDQPAAPSADGQGASLQAWYLEVMREPGMSEFIQVNAESAEHARAIVRDYRGDPRIIRGPSIRPLD